MKQLYLSRMNISNYGHKNANRIQQTNENSLNGESYNGVKILETRFNKACTHSIKFKQASKITA